MKTAEISFSGKAADENIRKGGRAQTAADAYAFPKSRVFLKSADEIRESMEEPAKIHGMDISRGQEIHDMMKRLQLREELLYRYPHQLSGGELQRVCLGRLLLLKPGLLILDEPTSMLDVSVQAQIIGILKEVQEEENISYLFISHDLDLLRACCHRIGILNRGKLVEMEETERLFHSPVAPYTKN